MKLRRRHVLAYFLVLSVAGILIISQSYDKFSRNQSINLSNKSVIESYLDDDEITYLVDNNIDVNLFLKYIKEKNFSIYNYQYYNLVSQYDPHLSKAQIVTNGNNLNQVGFPLNNLKRVLDNKDYTLEQILSLSNNTSPYNKGAKVEFYPSSELAISNHDNYVGNYKPRNLVAINGVYTNYKKLYLIEDANKHLNLMCHHLEILTNKKCGGLKISDAYVSFNAAKNKKLQKRLHILPGHNEFQLGRSIVFDGNVKKFMKSRVYLWLLDNAPSYGFVQRYPSGKKDLTKVDDLQNVFRYVGVDTAKALTSRNISIEEAIR